MKKISVLFALSVIVFACTRKASPTASTPTPVADTVVVSSTTATDANLLAAGHTIFTTKCSKCHATKNVSGYTATQWDGILKKMIPMAKLNETEAAQVTAYVKANAKAGQP